MILQFQSVYATLTNSPFPSIPKGDELDRIGARKCLIIKAKRKVVSLLLYRISYYITMRDQEIIEPNGRIIYIDSSNF